MKPGCSLVWVLSLPLRHSVLRQRFAIKIFCSSDSFILLLSSTPPNPVTSVALMLILSVIITISDHRGITGRNRHLSWTHWSSIPWKQILHLMLVWRLKLYPLQCVSGSLNICSTAISISSILWPNSQVTHTKKSPKWLKRFRKLIERNKH